MSYLKIWIHAVWSTKYRMHLLIPQIRAAVFKHIKDTSIEKGIFVDFINGHSDHAHILLSLGKNQTMADIMQSIKGESSHWINKNKLTSRRFMWQDDYWAASVSPQDVPIVRNYIKYQAVHHRTVTLEYEIRCMFNEYDPQEFKDSG